MSFGGTVKLTGESEYRKALNQITDNLKVLGSEMKLVSSQYDKNDTSSRKLKETKEVLNKKIEEQKEKVDLLKKALADSESETGKNSTTTKKWQNELNNAQAELNKMNRELDETPKKTKNASEGFTVFKGILANLGSQAIMSALNGIKQLGSTIVDLGKQAINSYADFEQLVGGVDTLFKESSVVVQDYANRAYKTAGLSANEYMSTVTSFSASLLQSLNGDTAKSAEIADMAITDMADNANKMGTSMEMIQNAYQGFAKQNYTMLDNLKLGYGGTKTEMERLLADASAISGLKYDISNLNDVYQAIHVIQNEMGITGTTAKEASSTISGSIASMKSAWQNVLTGLSVDMEAYDTTINEFVSSVLTVADNLIPVIQNIMMGLGTLVSGLLEELVPQLVEMIPTLIADSLPSLLNSIQVAINSIISLLPSIVSAFSALVPTIISNLVSLLPQILQAGITILLELINGISQSLPTLIPTIVDTVILIVETLIDNIDLIIDAGIQLILGLADGLIEALPRLIEKIPEIIEKLIDAIIRNFPKIVSAGGELLGKLVMGITGSVWKLMEVAPQLISTVVKGIKNGLTEIKNTGKYLIQGLWDGISGMANWVYDKVKSFANNIVKNIKKALGINSPSKVLSDEVGKNMALGVGDGFSETMKNISSDMVNAIPTEFDTNVSMSSSSSIGSSYDMYVNAFKDALKDVKVVMDGREMGTFVADTIEGVVYS